MNYCEDCVLLDLCGNEGCLDDALVFCDYKQQFIRRSVIEDIRAEINQEYLAEGHHTDYWVGIDKCLEIIDKHTSGNESV